MWIKLGAKPFLCWFFFWVGGELGCEDGSFFLEEMDGWDIDKLVYRYFIISLFHSGSVAFLSSSRVCL